MKDSTESPAGEDAGQLQSGISLTRASGLVMIMNTPKGAATECNDIPCPAIVTSFPST